MQSTRIWPGCSASRRLLRFSDWARKGTVRKTISARRAASSLSSPSTWAPGTFSRSVCRRLLGTLRRARADRDRGAGPSPALGEAGAERAGAADDRDGGEAPATAVAPSHMLQRRACELEGQERRWSPAARAGSAPRSRPGSPPRAPRSGSATSTPRAPTKVAGEVNGHALELDVTELESASAAVEAIGTLDILVNNAGTDEFGFFTYTTPEQWQRVIGDQPGRRPQLHPRGAAGDAAGQVRPHRQHLLGGGPGRLEGLGRLLRRQGRHRRLHEGDRA